jgi:hypothetical protein
MNLLHRPSEPAGAVIQEAHPPRNLEELQTMVVYSRVGAADVSVDSQSERQQPQNDIGPFWISSRHGYDSFEL